MNQAQRGIFWAVISMLLWSTSFPTARALIGGGLTDPITLGILRYAIGGGLMMALAPLFKCHTIFRVAHEDMFKMAFLGLIGTALMGFLLFTAQKTVSSVNASMVEALSPLLIFLIGSISARRFSLWQAIGLFCGFGGCLMVLKVTDGVSFHLSAFQFGDILVFCASFCWAIYTVWGRKTISRVGGYAFTAWTMCFGAMWLLLLALFQQDTLIMPSTAKAWELILYFAVLPTAGGFFAWNEAQNYISLNLLSLSQYFTPMCSAFFAAVFLGELLTKGQVTGAVVICGAALIEPEVTRWIISRKPSTFIFLKK